MNKYPISFNGTWAGTEWTLANITYYNDAGEVVTDTALATQYSINIINDSLGGLWFNSCEFLTNITVPTSTDSNDKTKYTHNITYDFRSLPALETIIFSGDMTYVDLLGGDYTSTSGSFFTSSGLKNITLPKAPTTVGGIENDGFDSVFAIPYVIENIYVPESDIEATKTAFANYPSLVPLVKATPVPVSEFKAKMLQEEGVDFVPVAHAESTYLNEDNAEGKSKTVAEKLGELESAIGSSTGDLTALQGTVDSHTTALNTLNGTDVGSVTNTATTIVNDAMSWVEVE